MGAAPGQTTAGHWSGKHSRRCHGWCPLSMSTVHTGHCIGHSIYLCVAWTGFYSHTIESSPRRMMSRVCVQKYIIGAMYSIGGGDGTRTNFPLHIWAVGSGHTLGSGHDTRQCGSGGQWWAATRDTAVSGAGSRSQLNGVKICPAEDRGGTVRGVQCTGVILSYCHAVIPSYCHTVTECCACRQPLPLSSVAGAGETGESCIPSPQSENQQPVDRWRRDSSQ